MERHVWGVSNKNHRNYIQYVGVGGGSDKHYYGRFDIGKSLNLNIQEFRRLCMGVYCMCVCIGMLVPFNLVLITVLQSPFSGVPLFPCRLHCWSVSGTWCGWWRALSLTGTKLSGQRSMWSKWRWNARSLLRQVICNRNTDTYVLYIMYVLRLVPCEKEMYVHLYNYMFRAF